ncbi:hypothetical protein [Streptomyces sp. NPDC029004]
MSTTTPPFPTPDPRSESVRRLVAEAFAPKSQQQDQHEALPA